MLLPQVTSAPSKAPRTSPSLEQPEALRDPQNSEPPQNASLSFPTDSGQGNAAAQDPLPTLFSSYPSFKQLRSFIRLASDISDDGYNDVFPIHDPTEPQIFEGVKSYSAEKLTSRAMAGSPFDTKPSPRENVTRKIPVEGVFRCPLTKPIQIFVGTWNTEYKEFPYDAMLSSSVSSKQTGAVEPAALNAEICSTAVGSTEEESMKIRKLVKSQLSTEIISLKDSNENMREERFMQEPGIRDSLSDNTQGSSCDKDSFSDAEYDSTNGRLEVSDGGGLESAKKRVKNKKKFQPLPDGYEPFQDWIPTGYDVYVIALQESTSNRLFKAILVYINRVNKREFCRIKFQEDKISGLGDGAYLSTKSTAIGCFVAVDVLGFGRPVNIGSSKGFALSSLNGSKGAVAIVLTIHNQICCFVSCHLPAGKPDERYKARNFIRKKLAETYCGFTGVEPTDVFHHIIWAGDFNLRIQEIRSKTVLEKLYASDTQSVLAFDEFEYGNFNADFKQYGFEEPPITFLPTYKKIAGVSLSLQSFAVYGRLSCNGYCMLM